MRLAISSQKNDLESKIDPRLGRAPFFLIADLDTNEFEFIENTSLSLGHGAGINTANLLKEKNVDAVLTQNVGPNAHGALCAAGIDVYSAKDDITVKKAVAKFQSGGFEKYAE